VGLSDNKKTFLEGLLEGSSYSTSLVNTPSPQFVLPLKLCVCVGLVDSIGATDV